MLGDPEYIQLLVNPDEGEIVVQCAESIDYLAHRMRNKDNELYSKDLVNRLEAISAGWTGSNLIHLHGKIIGGTAAVFSLGEIDK